MKKKKVSVIGLGFVGLPTACILSNLKKNKKNIFSVCGIDNNLSQIKRKIYNKVKYSEDIKLNKLIENLPNNNMPKNTIRYRLFPFSSNVVLVDFAFFMVLFGYLFFTFVLFV